jgi:predicted ATPase
MDCIRLEGGDARFLVFEAQGERVVTMALPRDRTVLSHDIRQNQPYQAIASELRATEEYRFDPDKLCEPSIPEPEPILKSSGDNLASVLDGLQNNPDRSGFAALERDLHAAIPTIQGITLPPWRGKQGAKAIEFILSGNDRPPVTIPARLASSGALLLTAFLALAYDQTPGLLLIEEPENGLHPSRLEMVIDLLRRIGRGEVGNRKRQVVVTTHSPLLLNYVKPEEVRVFIRDLEHGTKVMPMKEVPDIDKLLKEFATGELWYLLGEEKLFEGKPA